jgi:hypothetical protein
MYYIFVLVNTISNFADGYRPQMGASVILAVFALLRAIEFRHGNLLVLGLSCLDCYESVVVIYLFSN